MNLEELQKNTQKIAGDTIGAIFTLTTNGKEWTLIITKGATKFKGTLSEVLQCYNEEIISYRKPFQITKQIRSQKKFKYE